MKGFAFILYIVTLVTFVSAEKEENLQNDFHQIIQPSIKFTNALYSALTKQRKMQSFIFSPALIHYNLAICLLKAGGKTAEQLAAILHLPEDEDALLSALKAYHYFFFHIHGGYYSILNKMYINNRTNITENIYNSTNINRALKKNIQPIEFGKSKFDEEFVHSLIRSKYAKSPKFFKNYVFNKETQMVLLSAISLRGQMTYSSPSDSESKLPCHVMQQLEGKVVHCAGHFRNAVNDNLGANVVEMQFKNAPLKFVLVVPLKAEGLPEVEEKLRTLHLNKLLDSDDETKKYIRIQFPNFGSKGNMNLKHALKSLGAVDMFEPILANFSKITSTEMFHADQVIHQSIVKIKVNNVPMEEQNVVDKEGQINAGSAFIYLIQCRITGSIVFMGRFIKSRQIPHI